MTTADPIGEIPGQTEIADLLSAGKRARPAPDTAATDPDGQLPPAEPAPLTPAQLRLHLENHAYQVYDTQQTAAFTTYLAEKDAAWEKYLAARTRAEQLFMAARAEIPMRVSEATP